MDAQETKIYIAVLITCVVLGFIIGYFIISLIKHQRKTLELNKKNILAEITALEKERARIASDLHDEVGPMLSAIKMKINSFELSEEEDRIQVEKTSNHIDELIKRMREISFDLMPNSLLRKGLNEALSEFAGNITLNSAMKIDYSFQGNLILPEQMAVNIYRILQEVIQNSLKHSQATKMVLELTNQKNILLIHISDNGIGFNYENELKENVGFGLKNLQSRTQILGGNMFSDCSIGNGTHYKFEIPL